MEKLFCFIKFTNRIFAEKLINEGQIYFSLPSYFNEITEKERGDDTEGAEWVDTTQIVNIKAEHPTLGTFEFYSVPDSSSKVIQYNYFFLSYSLYAISPVLFDVSNTHKIDSRMTEFGDTAVIIEEPYIFLNALTTKLKSLNIRYDIKPAQYRNLSNGRTDLSPFDKKQEHEHQCEFGIIIENTDNTAKSIEIGSIASYCKIVSSESMIETEWKAK